MMKGSGMPENPTPPSNPTTPTFDNNQLGTAGGYEKDTAQTTNVSLDDVMSGLPQFRQGAGINMPNAQEVDVPMFGGASKKLGSIWDQLKGFGQDIGNEYKVNYRQALKDRGLYNEPQKNPYSNPNSEPTQEELNAVLESNNLSSNVDFDSNNIPDLIQASPIQSGNQIDMDNYNKQLGKFKNQSSASNPQIVQAKFQFPEEAIMNLYNKFRN